MEELVKIPGVGRKTANVILGHVFGKPGFVVDTHVRRLTYRLGFTRNTDPAKIEIDMQKILPAKDWTPFSMRLILHGRQICIARKPKCEICAIAGDCPRVGVGKSPRRPRGSKSGSPSSRGRVSLSEFATHAGGGALRDFRNRNRLRCASCRDPFLSR